MTELVSAFCGLILTSSNGLVLWQQSFRSQAFTPSLYEVFKSYTDETNDRIVYFDGETIIAGALLDQQFSNDLSSRLRGLIREVLSRLCVAYHESRERHQNLTIDLHWLSDVIDRIESRQPSSNGAFEILDPTVSSVSGLEPSDSIINNCLRYILSFGASSEKSADVLRARALQNLISKKSCQMKRAGFGSHVIGLAIRELQITFKYNSSMVLTSENADLAIGQAIEPSLTACNLLRLLSRKLSERTLLQIELASEVPHQTLTIMQQIIRLIRQIKARPLKILLLTQSASQNGSSNEWIEDLKKLGLELLELSTADRAAALKHAQENHFEILLIETDRSKCDALNDLGLMDDVDSLSICYLQLTFIKLAGCAAGHQKNEDEAFAGVIMIKKDHKKLPLRLGSVLNLVDAGHSGGGSRLLISVLDEHSTIRPLSVSFCPSNQKLAPLGRRLSQGISCVLTNVTIH